MNKTTVRAEGARAFREGTSREWNPYPAFHPARPDWFAGWDEASRVYEQSDDSADKILKRIVGGKKP